MPGDPLFVVGLLARVFDDLGIQYFVGGSLASSVYGIPRATQDVDLVADLRMESVQAVCERLANSFYIDVDMVRKAVVRNASFNVIHLDTMFKADIFIMKGDAWSREEMRRARPERLDGPQGSVQVRFASREDTLLHKLLWYKLGNATSDRQWTDILGVLKVQRSFLDDEYLDRWAPSLGVEELLEQARRGG